MYVHYIHIIHLHYIFLQTHILTSNDMLICVLFDLGLLLSTISPMWAGTMSILSPYFKVWHGVTPQSTLVE